MEHGLLTQKSLSVGVENSCDQFEHEQTLHEDFLLCRFLLEWLDFAKF